MGPRPRMNRHIGEALYVVSKQLMLIVDIKTNQCAQWFPLYVVHKTSKSAHWHNKHVYTSDLIH